MYKISQSNTCLVSGTYFSRAVLLRDMDTGSWELFNEESIPTYLKRGANLLKEKVDDIANLSTPLSEKGRKEVRFMLEALLESRQTIEDLEEYET